MGGEDLFMQKCMDKHGVAKVFNFSMKKRPLSVRSAQGTAESERTCGLDAGLPFSRKAGHAAPIPDARRVFRVPCQHTEGMGVGKQALDTLSEIWNTWMHKGGSMQFGRFVYENADTKRRQIAEIRIINSTN